jgi:hypothetical protein
MKELQHADCGGELVIDWVYNDGHGVIEIDFECLKCKEEFSYTENME